MLTLTLLHRLDRRLRRRIDASDDGQTTAEYALVLVAVAGLVGLFTTWAENSSKINELFDKVFSSLTGSFQ